jgi:two-component system sensor histidine kinase/response regulator
MSAQVEASDEPRGEANTDLVLQDLQNELHEAKIQLSRRLEELQACNEEAEAFAYVVAHDLKNPLSAVLGFSTMLQERYVRSTAEQVNHALVAIERSARRIDGIIGQLLQLSGVRRTEGVQVEALDMSKIVAEALDRLSLLIGERQAQVRAPDEWPMALGHSRWVVEVWANYVSNAIKYGGCPPHVELGADPAEGTLVRFWVRDYGPGLTPERQALLFTPFEHMHQIRAQGHGLGLSLVRRIVEKLGGEVGVESKPGKGSLFFFTLPARPES